MRPRSPTPSRPAARRSSSTSPPRSTCAAPSPSRSSTSASTSAGTAQPARGSPADGSAALHPRLHRRGDLRRGRRAPAPPRRAGRMQAGCPLRPEQVRGRGLSVALRPPLRALCGCAAARQRLRIATGPARGGRRGGDLLRGAARRRHPAGVRRRTPDARLRLRGRRGRGVPGGGGVGGAGDIQHRHRGRDERARAGPAAGGRLRPRVRSGDGSAAAGGGPADRDRQRARRRASWAGGPGPPSSRGCGRPRFLFA